MRALMMLLGLLILCVVSWLIAGWISPDAIQSAVMLLFGLLAGIPTAALIMASGRQRVREEDEEEYDQSPAPVMNSYPPAPAYSDIDDWFPQTYHDSPRVIGLPTSVEQQRFRRRAKKGVIKKLTADSGPVPPGFRKLSRTDGKIAVMD